MAWFYLSRDFPDRLARLEQKVNLLIERNKFMNEQLARLLKEVSETKGQNASILAFARGVPDLVRKAVDAALAANPSLTPEDLAAVSQAADDLDAGQQEIAAAINANPAPGETPVTPPVEPSA